jgi:hypothetical protein
MAIKKLRSDANRNLVQRKEVARDPAKSSKSAAAPSRSTAACRPLVRRQHTAGIPLNDPNCVF